METIYSKDWVTIPSKCKHPDFIKIGPHQVYVKAYRDFAKSDYEAISKLDVFIGLTSSFDLYETTVPTAYKNTLLNEIARGWTNLKAGSVPDNIIALEVPDMGVDEDIVTMCLALLEKKKRIGIGCYGAHGRTGWLLARLIKHFEGMDGDQAVRAVRTRFCVECVESYSQIKDLGSKTERGSKEFFDSKHPYASKKKDECLFPAHTPGAGETSLNSYESRYNPVHDVRGSAFDAEVALKDYYERMEQEQEDRTPRTSDDYYPPYTDKD